MIHVRAATASDSEAIASINVRSWQASYRGIMPDAHLAALNQQTLVPRVRDVIVRGESTVLVLDNPDVKAYCHMTKSRDDDANPDTAEIVAIYVAPGFERQGLGRCLATNCCDIAKQQSFARVTLWTLDENKRACAFYEALGFVADGHDKTTIRWGGTPLREIRFARLL